MRCTTIERSEQHEANNNNAKDNEAMGTLSQRNAKQLPASYADCDSIWRTRKRKVANNTTLVRNASGSFGLKLHNTQVVTFHEDGSINLDSNEWRTTTTKQRMNAALRDTAWHVFQKHFVWYVHNFDNGKSAAFEDGMCLLTTVVCTHIVRCAVTQEQREWALETMRSGRSNQVAMAAMALNGPCTHTNKGDE